MLDFMRRNAGSRFIKAIFIALIASFFLWGVAAYNEDAPTTFAARVNGDEVSVRAVTAYARQLESFYKRMYGDQFTPELAQSLDIRTRALEQMINRTLLRQEAERIGFEVGEEEVRTVISGIDGLTVDGRFRRDIYFRFVRMQGMTPAEFEEQQKDDIYVRKVQNLITSSIPIDDMTARDRWSFENEKVNLTFVKLDAESFLKDVTVEPAEVKAYFEKVQETFREPERVAIEVVAYPKAHFTAGAEIPADDIRQEFELHRDDRYTKPEELKARHILARVEEGASTDVRAQAKTKAEAALARLKAGEDFAAVAKEVSDDASNKDQGGELGTFTRGRMVEAFENTAFALPAGQLSEVVETSFGYHVIRVDEKHEKKVQTLEEVTEEIRERLRGEKSETLARDAAYEDSQKALAGTSLGELATARGLQLTSPLAFSERENPVGVPRIPQMMKTVFGTAAGEVAPVVENAGIFYLYRVKEKIASKIPPFEEIQRRVEMAMKDERAADKAREKGEKIRTEAAAGKPLADVAKAEGLTVQETGDFTRAGEYVPKIGGVVGLRREAFALTPEKPLAPEVYVTSRSAYVVALGKNTPAIMADYDKDKAKIAERYSEEQQKLALDVFLDQLKEGAQVEVSPDVMARLA